MFLSPTLLMFDVFIINDDILPINRYIIINIDNFFNKSFLFVLLIINIIYTKSENIITIPSGLIMLPRAINIEDTIFTRIS